MKYTYSNRKGQFNLTFVTDLFEQISVVFHANTLVPIKDTLHFGIKPGHFMVYTKKWNEEGKWLIKDAGYINYFRADQKNIIQTEYNTLAKQKLLSRGVLFKSINNNIVTLISFSLFPIHCRIFKLNMNHNRITIKDYFLWKTDIFYNFWDKLKTKTAWFFDKEVITLN
jgi:hypothetical protein